MTAPPRVSAVVVSYNTRLLTLDAVGSLLSQRGIDLDVQVVDNASSDGSVEALAEAFPGVRVVALESNVGFGRANNLAMAQATGAYFLLLNSDAVFKSEADLLRLVQALEEDAATGVVGPRLEGIDGALEYSARGFPGALRELERRSGLYRLRSPGARARRYLGDFFRHDRRLEVEWLTGACLLLRRAVWEDTGGFDPAIFMYGEEQEWFWRIRRAGWKVVFDPAVRVVHRRGASSPERRAWRVEKAMEGDLYLFRRHRRPLARTAFAAARLLALAVETALFGGLALTRRSPYPRARAAAAGSDLRAWWRVLRRGGEDEAGASGPGCGS